MLGVGNGTHSHHRTVMCAGQELAASAVCVLISCRVQSRLQIMPLIHSTAVISSNLSSSAERPLTFSFVQPCHRLCSSSLSPHVICEVLQLNALFLRIRAKAVTVSLGER